jgi:hypothetical protein
MSESNQRDLDLPLADELTEYAQQLGSRVSEAEMDFDDAVMAYRERLAESGPSPETIDFVQMRLEIRADQTGEAAPKAGGEVALEAARGLAP